MKRALLVVALALAGAALMPGIAHATVCENVDRKIQTTPVFGKGGDKIANVHYFLTRDERICTVLRATKWVGTPHYMYLRVCANPNGNGPGPGPGTGCSGFDAGKYSYYAGPIYHRHVCASYVIIDTPSGNRVHDGFVPRCF
jgi:hypothetical protein